MLPIENGISKQQQNMGSLRNSWRTFLLLIFWLSSTFIDGNAQHLVIYAGPHKAASTSVEQFFYENASDHSLYDKDGKVIPDTTRQKTIGMRYWLWPRIYGEAANVTEAEHPYKIFGHLVSDHDNAVLKNEILGGIQKSWETEGISGVILGSEMFDQIGRDVEYNATDAIRDIVDYLGVPKNQVTVVMNYRTPRLEQWASTWAHAAVSDESAEENYSLKYEEWLCSRDRAKEHIKTLATEMNPMNAAQAFVDEGWNVRLIDMKGAQRKGRDIPHVIACDVATARCNKDGNVRNHAGDNPQANVLESDLDSLTREEQGEAEQLLRSRDCAYMHLGTSTQFGVLFNLTTLVGCEPENMELYNKLKERPDLIYAALVDQVQCPNSEPDFLKEGGEKFTIHEALTGEKPARSKASKKSTNSNRQRGGSFLIQFVIMVGILCGLMAYQYRRMIHNASAIPVGLRNTPLSTPAGSRQEAQDQLSNLVDAEYGDAESDEDEANPSVYHDARRKFN